MSILTINKNVFFFFLLHWHLIYALVVRGAATLVNTMIVRLFRNKYVSLISQHLAYTHCHVPYQTIVAGIFNRLHFIRLRHRESERCFFRACKNEILL